jgi:putative transcriptional regulator
MDLSGTLLIAPPKLKSNFWYKSVIFVTEHHANGSMGLILNKRSEMTVSEFSEQVGIARLNIPGYIYLGGPVNIKALSMLHSSEWSCSNTMQINEDFSISSAEDLLVRLGDGDAPRQFRLFLGLCGWAPRQLAEELKGTSQRDHSFSWLTASADYESVFDNDLKDQWNSAVERSGNEFVQSILT